MTALADWLCTFALHSTGLLAGAWLLSSALRGRAIAFQERLLRSCLWMALVSTSVQCFVLGSPLALALPAPVATDAVALPTEPAPGTELPAAGVLRGAPALANPARISFTTWLVGGALALAMGGGLWLLRAHLRLRRVLRDREPETAPRLLAITAEVSRALGLRNPPRLSRSPHLATPIAFGWFRQEICVPERAATLDEHPLRALLAHELAHLRRGDPAWMGFATLVQALFPWQVLAIAVQRRWARLVELRCDAVAVAQSSPTAVARCLVDVAGWLRPPATVPFPALAMAARPSALRERIEAALSAQPERPARSVLTVAFGALTLTSLTLAAPGVHSAPEEVAVTAPSAPSLREAFDLLEAEHAMLAEEVATLRAELAGRAHSQELEQLVSVLTRRLLDFERSRSRLSAQLDRRISPK